MRSFEILPHTADVGFRATGASLPDLFETAARAMFSIEYDLSAVAVEEERVVEARADDVEGLLEAWLSELLWLHDATGFVPGTVAVTELVRPGGPLLVDPAGLHDQAGGAAPQARITGTAGGRQLGDWFEQTGAQIKAVTLHGLDVRQVDGSWQATVYLDV